MSVDNVLKWASKVTLVNGYGPTEASVIAIANPEVSTQRDASNIGRALPSGQAWIVDSQDHNHMAPVGCVGELLLDGPLLAREYINNESKTKEAFIERPSWAVAFDLPEPTERPPLSRFQSNQSGRFSFTGRDMHPPLMFRSPSDYSHISGLSHPSRTSPPGKMYKTGDLCKYSHDGSIIFIGRKDHQYESLPFSCLLP